MWLTDILDTFRGGFRRPSIRDRAHQRIFCELPAQLILSERSVSLSGLLIEVSRGGALFREASRYILDRKKASVVLVIGNLELPGTIVNVRSVGYGIRFERMLSEDLLAHLAGDKVSTAA